MDNVKDFDSRKKMKQIVHTAMAAPGELERVREFMKSKRIKYEESEFVKSGYVMLISADGPVAGIDMVSKEAVVMEAGRKADA